MHSWSYSYSLIGLFNWTTIVVPVYMHKIAWLTKYVRPSEKKFLTLGDIFVQVSIAEFAACCGYKTRILLEQSDSLEMR